MRLAEQFHSWTNMEIHGLSNNGVISDGDMFVISGGLQQLNLLNNCIYLTTALIMQFATALAEGIQNCPLLHPIYVSKNLIGSYDASVLAQSMKCPENKYMDI